MRDDFGKAIFEATFSGLANHVFEKQLLVNKIEMNLLRKFEGKAKNVGSHISIIKHCRKTVDSLDAIIKDIKDYFSELKISSLYVLFESIYRNLVYSMKVLSECYLKRFEDSQTFQIDANYKKKVKDETIVTSENAQEPLSCFCHHRKKEDAKKIEFLDYEIASIENREIELQHQMHILMPNLWIEKEKVEMVMDSTGKYEMFEEVEKVLSEIAHKSEYFFGSFLRGINDFDSQYNSFLKPEDIEEAMNIGPRKEIKKFAKQKLDEIINTIQNILKDKFRKKVEAYDEEIGKITKSNSQEGIILNNENIQKNVTVRQNSSPSKNGVEFYDFERENGNKFESDEFSKGQDNLKKQNRSLYAEVSELKESLKKEKRESAQVKHQIEEMEKLFKKRTYELESSKTELKYVIQKSNRESLQNILAKKGDLPENVLNMLKNHNVQNGKETADQSTQKDLEEDNIFMCSMGYESRPFFESKLKNKKMNSFISNDKEKGLMKFRNIENILKGSLEEINGLMYKEGNGKEKEQKEEQRKEVDVLMKQEKYGEIIDKIKTKLNDLYQDTVKMNNNESGKGMKRQSKSKKSIGRLSSVKIEITSINASTQTEQRKTSPKPNRVLCSPNPKTNLKPERSESRFQRRSKMKTVESGERLLSDETVVNEEKKDRMIPISSLLTRFTSESSNKFVKESIIVEKGRYQSNRNRGNRCSEILSDAFGFREEKKDRKDRYPSKFLENSLFEQLNFQNNNLTHEKTRQLMEKTLNIKAKAPGEKSEANLKSKISIRDSFGVPTTKEETKENLMKNMEFVMEAAEEAQIYEASDLKVPSKYQDLLVGILRRASSTISKDIVSEAIEKYKSENPSDESDEEQSLSTSN